MLGATDVVDPNQGDPVAQVKELLHGRGVDVAIDAVGASALIEQAAAMTRRGGTTVLVGAPRYDATRHHPPDLAHHRGPVAAGQLLRRHRGAGDFPRYIGLIESGRLDLSSMVSRRISLDDLGEVLTSPPGDAIRHVVV